LPPAGAAEMTGNVSMRQRDSCSDVSTYDNANDFLKFYWFSTGSPLTRIRTVVSAVASQCYFLLPSPQYNMTKTAHF
jgi:hypothetical protein